MKKLVYYGITPKLETMLDNSLHKFENRYKVKLAAVTTHGYERLTERDISPRQRAILAQKALRRIAFAKEQVSEVRVIQVNGQNFPVSVVVDDVVIGIHPRNLPREAINHGFGTREGENFGVIKTVLSRPNERARMNFVGEYQVMG